MSAIFRNKRVLITGATGSLGGTILRKIMEDTAGFPNMIRVFSRDESKQYKLRAELEKAYGSAADIIEYVIGDIRSPRSVYDALTDIQLVIHTAALKHVPVCEKNTTEAIEINVTGAENLVQAVAFHAKWVEKVVALSTDKACNPFSFMGMTKAIQERIFAAAVFRTPVPFICVRLGNMIMSRGSVVPLFLNQISKGGPLTITDPQMTRFFITMEEATDHVIKALRYARSGQVYIPEMKAAGIVRLARALSPDYDPEIKTVGIRPGEKLHDILVSKDETPYLKPCAFGGYLLENQFNRSKKTAAPYPFKDISSADTELQMTDEELKTMLGSAVSLKQQVYV